MTILCVRSQHLESVTRVINGNECIYSSYIAVYVWCVCVYACVHESSCQVYMELSQDCVHLQRIIQAGCRLVSTMQGRNNCAARLLQPRNFRMRLPHGHSHCITILACILFCCINKCAGFKQTLTVPTFEC